MSSFFRLNQSILATEEEFGNENTQNENVDLEKDDETLFDKLLFERNNAEILKLNDDIATFLLLDKVEQHASTEAQMQAMMDQEEPPEAVLPNPYLWNHADVLWLGQDLLCQGPLELEDRTQDPFIIHVCPFQINTESRSPFLQFLLHRPAQADSLRFPRFQAPASADNTLICMICEKILVLIKRAFLMKSEDMPVYRGFFNRGRDIFCFYDFTSVPVGCHLLSTKNDLWLCLVDEICGDEGCAVVGVTVGDEVRHLFQEFPALVQLWQKIGNHGIMLPTPKVGYIGTQRKMGEFVATFGVSKLDDPESRVDDCGYAFTDFSNACRMAHHSVVWETHGGWGMNSEKSPSRHVGAVNRFALFLGSEGETKSSVCFRGALFDPTRESSTMEYAKEDAVFFTGTSPSNSGEGAASYTFLRHYDDQVALTFHYLKIDGEGSMTELF